MTLPFKACSRDVRLSWWEARLPVEPAAKTHMLRAFDVSVGNQVVHINGVRPNGAWLANQGLCFSRRSLRLFTYTLFWLDAGPLGRLAIEAEMEKVDAS